MENQSKENQRKLNASKKKQANERSTRQAYARYSGMAIQLGATIAVGAFIGRKLDDYFLLEKPLLTAFFSLLATVGGIYVLIRDLVK